MGDSVERPRDMVRTSRPPRRRASARRVFAWIGLFLLPAGWWVTASCRVGSAPGSAARPDAGGSAPAFAELVAGPLSEELPGELVVYFLDVGQGDACCLRTPAGKTVVIDAGGSAEPVIGFLLAKDVAVIDVLVFSHPHEDHIGGALGLLEQFEVRVVCDSGFAHPTPVYESVLEKALELSNLGRLAYARPRAGDDLDWDPGLTVSVLHPAGQPDAETGANEASLVLRVAFGSFAVLFTGDAGLESEEAILGSGREVRSTVLKVGHHGSSGATGEAFLETVAPEAAVISAGRGNPFGHPSPAVLDRLARAGAAVYVTAEDGIIIVHSDGENWAVVTGP